MPSAKRTPRERTDDYAQIQQWCRTPEQRLYEGIRPIVLFGLTTTARAQETGLAEATVRRAADAFDTHGMVSLFRPVKAQRVAHHRSLPVLMRQLIVDLKAEYADFTDGEIAAICAIQFDGRRPSHHTVKAVLADGPPPTRRTRQYPPYAQIADAEERRLAVIRLHAQGWIVSTIARYLEVSRPTIYSILKRWVEEGVRGMPDKSHANTDKGKTGVGLPTRNLIRKKQLENPLLGEFRMHAALKQLGMTVSARTCGRIMAEYRRLYGGWTTPLKPDRPAQPHSFKATYRHERWCLDIRYLEKHQILEIPGSFYVITVMEAFSRAVLSSAMQDLGCVLIVLYAAIERFGPPHALITDNGAVFRAKQLLQICEALGIEKEYIQPR